MAKEIRCEEVEEGDLVSAYVTGSMTSAQAEAFAEHYFACDGCWQQVRLANEVRAALRDGPASAAPSFAPRAAPSAKPSAPPPAAWTAWRGLLAASIVVAAVAGVWQLTPRSAPAPAPAPVFRGGGPLAVEGRLEKGQLAVSWPAVPGAASYRVELVAADGSSLLRRDAGETRIEIGVGDLPQVSRGPVYAKVVALDALGARVAVSDLALVRGAEPPR